MDGVYLTWLISALAIGVILMPFIKPPWAKVTMDGFIDFLRRYWLHIAIVLTIYNAKDFLDEVDRILMANTDGMLNMTHGFTQSRERWHCGFKRPSRLIG